MAAVQDLFRRLKLRRSVHKRTKDADTKDVTSPPLSDRTGVALPPVPFTACRDLPDISRDCGPSYAHYYDEIPAYAIDTRLDILRDAHKERNILDRLPGRDYNVESSVHNVSSSQPHPAHSHHTQQENHVHQSRGNNHTPGHNLHQSRDHHQSHDHHQSRDHHMPQWRQTPQRHYSLPRDGSRLERHHGDGDVTSARSASHRGRSTPWNRNYNADCDDSGSSDQLDQWVSVQEDLNQLSISEDRTQAHQASHQRPWYEQDNHPTTPHQARIRHLGSSVLSRGAHRSLEDIRTVHNYHEIPSSPPTTVHPENRLPHNSNSTKYPSPPPGMMSDDSGVSSPSSRESRSTPWGSGRIPASHRRQCGQYSDSDSSLYWSSPKAPQTRWCDQEIALHRRLPTEGDNQGQTIWNLDASCEGSSDTYNEYDQNNSSFSEFGTYPRNQHANESMTPQEYRFYLSKTTNNLQKTYGVSQIAKDSPAQDSFFGDVRESDCDVTIDSIDLTSVTSLSDVSTFSDDELQRVLNQRQSEHQHSRIKVSSTRRNEVITSSSQSKVNSKTHTKISEHSRNGNNFVKKTQDKQPQSDKKGPDAASHQSAFKPYQSKRRYSYTSSCTSTPDSISPTPSSIQTSAAMPQTMDLADKLSCRATVSKPRPQSATHRGSTSQLYQIKHRSFAGQSQTSAFSQNTLLSDIMRINHDRQILGLI